MAMQPLSSHSEIKHLGVQLTSTLDFTPHYNRIKKLFVQRVNLLCHMSQYLPSDAILILYKSYVRPVLEYAIPVWYHRLTKSQLHFFDLLQAKLCRRYLRTKEVAFNPHESKENLNILCHLQSLHFRRQILSLVVLFKFIHHHSDYLAQFRISLSSSKRRPNKLVFQSHGRYSSSLFLHKTGKLWNSLPPAITSLDSLVEFKKQLNRIMFNYKFCCTGIPG